MTATDIQQKPALASYGIESRWQHKQPIARRVLILYPHPDDESFGNAGTIIRYSASGAEVHYGCATLGECGTVSPPFLEKYESIGALRSAELDCAARTLGLAAVHYLGYRDSGMEGSSDNQHPDCLVQAPLEQVTGQVVALIRALRPQVVLTFGPYGGYGHPDHIKLHHATLQAFSAAGDPARYPEQIEAGLQPWAPQKLYYPTFRTLGLRINIWLLRLLRRDPRRFGENKDIDLVRVLEEVTPITSVVRCGEHVEQKIAAWRCHASQLGDLRIVRRLPAFVRRLLLGQEVYTRAIPAWRKGEPREQDLFDGVI